MKKIISIIIAAALLIPAAVQAKKNGSEETPELKVMSYNVRMGVAKDGTNSWQHRCPATIAMLDDQKPDVFGVQEAFDFQIEFIEELAEDYKSVGGGRDDVKTKGEYMSIFWNKKRVKLLKWGTFWISETPDVPSKGWDAHC